MTKGRWLVLFGFLFAILPRRSPQRRGERGANAERAGEMSPNLPLRDLCDLRASGVKEAQVFRERTFCHLHSSL